MDLEPVKLKVLAEQADVIVEAVISTPAREVRTEQTDDPCGGFAVQVYRFEVADVRVAPTGVTVPRHIDAYDPAALAEGAEKHASCVGAPIPSTKVPSIAETVPWNPGGARSWCCSTSPPTAGGCSRQNQRGTA